MIDSLLVLISISFGDHLLAPPIGALGLLIVLLAVATMTLTARPHEGRVEPGVSFDEVFVFRIAHNRAVSHVVKRAVVRERSLDALEAEPSTAGRSPEEHLDRAVRALRLQDAISGLPLGLRQPVIMALEGFKAKEIGEVLGISENAVSIRVTRARQVLRDNLANKGDGTR